MGKIRRYSAFQNKSGGHLLLRFQVSGKFEEFKCFTVFPVNQAELTSVCCPFSLNNSTSDIRTAKLSSPLEEEVVEEEARVPPAGPWLLACLLGIFSYACACLAVSDPNRFASRHLPTHPPIITITTTNTTPNPSRIKHSLERRPALQEMSV